MGRVIDPVPVNGNSFFESVYRQVAHGNLTPENMRNLVVRIGRRYPRLFYRFIAQSEGRFLEILDELQLEGVWFSNVWYMCIVMLTRVLRLNKIVVVQSDTMPVVIPDDGDPVDHETIVLVQSENFMQYHSTQPLRGILCFYLFICT